MPTTIRLTLILLATTYFPARAQTPLTHIDPQPQGGSSLAVVVEDVPLVHTAQLLPIDTAGQVQHAGDAAAQAVWLLDRLSQVLNESGSSLEQLVRLHICVKDEPSADLVREALARRFSGGSKPAVTLVAGDLVLAEALVALDAVAAAPAQKNREVKLLDSAAILPAGPRVFVSGQAEPGDLATATRGTLESLGRTLQFLGLEKSHVVQLKAFVTPIDERKTVMDEMQRFFGSTPTPPVVLVEWKSNLPIEIELVAASPRKGESGPGPTIEFLTPPGLKASPIFCRVTRVDAPRTIYTSGLVGSAGGSGEAQVRDIFAALGRLTQRTGSDLKHLAKATYYVSNNEASAKLNQIRPEFYDPARPPAASKAQVRGVGFAGRGIAVDMIAVPAGR